MWSDVDWNRVSRQTQINLRFLLKYILQKELENKLLKLECIRMFNRLALIAQSDKTFDMEYLENWLKEEIKKNERSS